MKAPAFYVRELGGRWYVIHSRTSTVVSKHESEGEAKKEAQLTTRIAA